MDTHSDILIVGGGLNGPALALALGNAGFSVRIVDSLPKDVREDAEFDGRAYALALGSQRLLSGIGVWPSVELKAQPMLEIKVTDGRAGEVGEATGSEVIKRYHIDPMLLLLAE